MILRRVTIQAGQGKFQGTINFLPGAAPGALKERSRHLGADFPPLTFNALCCLAVRDRVLHLLGEDGFVGLLWSSTIEEKGEDAYDRSDYNLEFKEIVGSGEHTYLNFRELKLEWTNSFATSKSPAWNAYETALEKWESTWPAVDQRCDKVIAAAQQEAESLKLSISNFEKGSVVVTTAVSFPANDEVAKHAFLRIYISQQLQAMGLSQVEWVPANTVAAKQQGPACMWPNKKDNNWGCIECGCADNRAVYSHRRMDNKRCKGCSRPRLDCEDQLYWTIKVVLFRDDFDYISKVEADVGEVAGFT